MVLFARYEIGIYRGGDGTVIHSPESESRSHVNTLLLRRADNRQPIIGYDVRARPAMLDGFNVQMLTCIVFKALVEHAFVRGLCGAVFACDDDHGTFIGGRGAVRVQGVISMNIPSGKAPLAYNPNT